MHQAWPRQARPLQCSGRACLGHVHCLTFYPFFVIVYKGEEVTFTDATRKRTRTTTAKVTNSGSYSPLQLANVKTGTACNAAATRTEADARAHRTGCRGWLQPGNR